MKVFSTVGNRLLVDDIVSELSLEQRASKAVSPLNNQALEIVVSKENRPRNTSAFIVGLGDDPWLYDEVVVRGHKRPRYVIGDKVYFAWSAGSEQIIEGHSFRVLEAHEVTGIERVLPDSQEQGSPSPSPEQGAGS